MKHEPSTHYGILNPHIPMVTLSPLTDSAPGLVRPAHAPTFYLGPTQQQSSSLPGTRWSSDIQTLFLAPQGNWQCCRTPAGWQLTQLALWDSAWVGAEVQGRSQTAQHFPPPLASVSSSIRGYVHLPMEQCGRANSMSVLAAKRPNVWPNGKLATPSFSVLGSGFFSRSQTTEDHEA